MQLPQGARVLLVRLSALGDVLFALETLASLVRERPDVRVDFLVEDRFAGVLRGHPQIDSVLEFPRRRARGWPRAIARLRRQRYDAALDLHGIFKSALQMRVARAALKIGFAPPISREGAHRAYHRAVTIDGERPHRAEQGYHLLRALGLRGEVAEPVLGLPDAAPFWGDGDRGGVVLHPGTSEFARFKRWPLAAFCELARRLRAAGRPVAVSFGPGEAALGRALCEAAPGVRALDGAQRGLLGLAAAFRDSAVVVAADTGPLHLAAAVGARVVALFGPKDPALYGPRGAGHRVLFHPVPCQPCRRRTCPAPLCVRGIGVDEVERAVLEAAR
jgi:ADP-heptose:LPS heptosyltransferase